MGVYHSRFSDNERVEVWNGVLTGRFKFVVGVRSSVFLPFDNLGLIIVDEEHDSVLQTTRTRTPLSCQGRSSDDVTNASRESVTRFCYTHPLKATIRHNEENTVSLNSTSGLVKPNCRKLYLRI